MTIDEALETLKDTRAGLYCAVDGNPTVYADALEMAIKALEQTRWIPCSERLDKIRAEIENEPYISKMEALDIIDRYRKEAET